MPGLSAGAVVFRAGDLGGQLGEDGGREFHGHLLYPFAGAYRCRPDNSALNPLRRVRGRHVPWHSCRPAPRRLLPEEGRAPPPQLIPSTHPVAAVDIVGLGDDVFGVVAGQEHRHAGQVLRLCPCGRKAPPRRPAASSRPSAGSRIWRTAHRHGPNARRRRRPARCALTLMRCLIRSSPADWVSEMTAALVAQ